MLNLCDANIRKLVVSDLPLVLKWRNSDHIRTKMYNDKIISWQEHQAWFDSLRNSQEKLCLIFEYQQQPLGVVSFSDVDAGNGTAFWGFYIGVSGVPKGAGTMLGFLGIEYAFRQLNIRKLCGEAFAFNMGSINFHRRFGFQEEGRFIKHMLKDGIYQDIIRFALFRETWNEQRETIKNKFFY